jgi:hypothetical protein
MNRREQELFLALCSFKKADKQKIRGMLEEYGTPEVLGQLFCNRMQAVAYGVIKDSGALNLADREFRNALAAAYEQNVSKNKSFFHSINLLTDILQEHRNRYAMLKGALLCKLYPDGYRTSNDIDLLVRPGDITEIGETLTAAGFRQGYIRNGVFEAADRSKIIESRMTRGETVPYILTVNLPFMPFLEVDINFSQDYKNGDGLMLESMMSHVQTVNNQGVKLETLNKYDFFIHLCCHLYKEATTLPWVKMGRDMTFYKFCDIYMLMFAFLPIEIDKLFCRAKELGAEAICSCVMLWTDALFQTATPQIQEYAKKNLEGRESILSEVIDPTGGRHLIYTEKDIRRRFFTGNRMRLLKEV